VRTLRHAVRHYVPSCYSGSVVLFRAEQFPAPRADLDWASVVPQLEGVASPGDHLTCITRHVASFGAHLNAILRRA
jgi:thioesterase domain-containing protein